LSLKQGYLLLLLIKGDIILLFLLDKMMIIDNK